MRVASRELSRPEYLVVPQRQCAIDATIDSTTLGGESARTLSELLAGRVAGVTVLRSSGLLGAGSRVRMRGGFGLLIPREPMLVVDGVRVDASQTSLGIDIGGQSPSRLDDISVDDIERVETLPGPAASALYGADAAGGVIVVTTKHGNPRALHWKSYVESGATSDATSYPANVATGPPTYGANTCTRANATTGNCTPGPIAQWNPLERASPSQTGMRVSGGATASGGSSTMQYYVGGSAAGDQGPLPPNDVRRYAGRANVDLRPLPSLEMALRGSYIASRTTLPLSDRFPISALRAGLLGNTADDPVQRGYYQEDPATIAGVVTRQRIERSLGSVGATWTPRSWLTVRGLAGREIVRRDDAQELTMAAAFEDPSRSGPWQLSSASGRDMRTTIGGSGTAALSLGSKVTSQTTLGVERLAQSFRVRDSSVRFFEDGTTAGSDYLTRHSSASTVGSFATQQLIWGPRQLLVGVRRDNGDRRELLEGATYWAANAEWALGDEWFFRRSRALSHLTIRAAYGVAGDTRPAAVVYSQPPGIPPSAGDTPPSLPSLAPETVSELELGLDARTLGDRLTLALTWYRQRSTNSYERGCCIAGPFFYDDKGAWHTNGVEVTAAGTAFRTPTSALIARLMFASIVNRYDGGPTNSSRTLDLLSWGGFDPARRRLMPGYPIAGLWGRPVTGRDTNGDGVIVPSEITRATDSVYLGPSIPTREAGVAMSLTVFRWLTLSGQFDYVGGFMALNATESWRCGSFICPALYTPGASLAEQTRAIAAFGETPAFNESADFVRFREASLAWVLAPHWSDRHGIGRLTLTVAGRNLFRWTKYSGLDPEVNALGQSTFSAGELFTLPLPRTFIVRLDVGR